MSFQASNCETNKTLFTSANTFLKGLSMITRILLPRILSALVGLLMAVQTISWITNPGEAAQGLGMALLEGMGRSTQIGDFSSFFFSVTLFCFLGAYLKQAQWLISGAIILGSAALFRSLAWIAHGADFATDFIVAEVVMTILLIVSAYLFNKSKDEVIESS